MAAPNGAQADARFHHFDAQIQALLRDAAQTLAQNGRFADDKHLRGIAVEFIFNHGHVDVDDITIFQMFSVIRNAVAHHFINRDTDGFRIAVVAEAGGDRVLFVNYVIVTDTVSSPVVTPGLIYGSIISSTSAARRPATRIFRCLQMS